MANQVIVKFIEMLIQNNRETDVSSQKKIFQTAVAVDAIYGVNMKVDLKKIECIKFYHKKN